MPILTVNNTPFNYPDPGAEPGWGEDATGWAEAVTQVLSSLLSPGDITETESNILDNNITALDVVTMIFDPSVVRAANIDYSIRRTDGSAVHTESGMIFLTYNSAAAPGSKFTLSQTFNGSAGVVFSVTDVGQVQYTSSNIGGGLNYQGTIVFKARTLSA